MDPGKENKKGATGGGRWRDTAQHQRSNSPAKCAECCKYKIIVNQTVTPIMLENILQTEKLVTYFHQIFFLFVSCNYFAVHKLSQRLLY